MTHVLEHEVDRLNQHVRELQETVGRWRRMVQGRAPQPEYLKERHDQGRHFIDIVVNDIPADFPLRQALRHIKNTILPAYYPYQYHAAYRSKKYGWVATFLKYEPTNMTYKAENEKEIAKRTLDSIQWEIFDLANYWERTLREEMSQASEEDKAKANQLIEGINALFNLTQKA